MEYIFWEIVILTIAIWAICLGIKILRQKDEEFITAREQRAREIAKSEGSSVEKAIQKFVDPMRRNTAAWRTYIGGRGVALGIVLLFAFAALLILDISK